VLEHVANPGRLLNRSRDHLRPDGRLLLTTDVPVSYWYLARELLGGRETHPEHVHSWGAPELRNIVERCGFRVEHHERYWFRRVGMSPADRLFAAIERVLNRIPVLDRGVAVQHFLVGQRADYGSARRPNGSSPSSKEATE
jgi:hypothetical protein